MLPPGVNVLDIGAGIRELTPGQIFTSARAAPSRGRSVFRRQGWQNRCCRGRRIPHRRAQSWIRDPIRPRGPSAIPTVAPACSTSSRPRPAVGDVADSAPTSGTTTTISGFGSGTNENQFLFDGMNNTCPCNGVARAEPGVDFIQEVHVQSIGASAEFGKSRAPSSTSLPSRERPVSLRRSVYAQTAGLTSRPVTIGCPRRRRTDGYRRGAVSGSDREASAALPFATGSGFSAATSIFATTTVNPALTPRCRGPTSRTRSFGKLTWRLAPSLQLVQSLHDEYGVNPEQADSRTPLETTARDAHSVPAMTFGHLTHTLSPSTVWDVRAAVRLPAGEHRARGTHHREPVRSRDGVTSGAPPSSAP